MTTSGTPAATTYTITSLTPPGQTWAGIDNAGLITFTASRPAITQATSYTFTVTATNGVGSPDSKTLTVTDLPALISYGTVGGSYSQNFDALVAPAAETSLVSQAGVTVPTAPVVLANAPFLDAAPPGTASNLEGWQFATVGGTNQRFAASAGTVGSGGGTYDFGPASDHDRALGADASSTGIGRFGAAFVNTTGSTLLQFTLNFIEEQWARGTATDTLSFEYGVGDAGSTLNTLVNGTFTPFTNLDLTTLNGAAAQGVLNGNDPLNQASKSANIGGITWAPGQILVIRWTDSDSGGTDDGLAVDGLTFSALATSDVAPTITSASKTTINEGQAGTFQVTASGNPATFTYTLMSGPAFATIDGAGLITFAAPNGGANGRTPSISTGTPYIFIVMVSNGVTPGAVQTFTVTDLPGPTPFNGGTYTQNFDLLYSPTNSATALLTQSGVTPPTAPVVIANSPFLNAAPPAGGTQIDGWQFATVAGTAQRFAAGDGSNMSPGAGVYDFGPTAGADRALGSTASTSNASRFGVALVNTTAGTTFTQFTLNYFVEQWFRGTSTNDLLAFSYSTTATGLNDDAAFTAFTTLDATAVRNDLATSGPLDGNAGVNRAAKTGTVGGLAWAPGQVLWLRWTDSDSTGTDDGLSVDDLQFTASTGGQVQPTITSASNTTITEGQAGTYQVTAIGTPSTFTYSLSGAPAFVNITSTGLLQFNVPVAGNGRTAVIDQGTPYTFTVNVDNGVAPVAHQTFTVTDLPGPASFTGGTYTENFDKLAAGQSETTIFSNAGVTPPTAPTVLANSPYLNPVPPVGASSLKGWQYATVAGTGQRFIASNGNTTTGAAMSFGASGLTDRALGALASASDVSRFGLALRNDTGNSIDHVNLAFTVEQWVRGSVASDTMAFSYSTTATGLNDDAAFTNLTALDLTTINTGPAGQLNGNDPANQAARSATISGITWAPGAVLYIRWTDADTTPGADDGLSVDNLSLNTATAGAPFFTSAATATFFVGAANSFTVTAAGMPAPTLTENPADVLPTGVTFNAGTGVLSGTPAAGTAGTYTLHFTAANSNGMDNQTITLVVSNTPPVNLRIVSYNITASGGTPRSGLDTILQAIGNETVGGQARPIDVLALQEVNSQSTTTQAVVDLLNGLYGAGTYARGTLNGASTGAGTQGIVYRQSVVTLTGEVALGTVGASGSGREARQPIRYTFHIIGQPATNDFYIYNSHMKSGPTSADLAQRLDEANNIRTDADGLGQGANILFVGDYNSQSSSEGFYQRLLSAGPGQAVDPINRPGNWNNSGAFVDIFTQAPALNPPGGLTGGGLDDRFDFQLNSGELADNTGLDYRTGTYHTFGNNGSLPVNGEVNDPNNTALPGLANRTTVLNLLTTVSDHLPVVADYYVVTQAQSATTTTLTGNGPNPSTFNQAVSFTATVTGGSAVNGRTVDIKDADNGNAIVASPTLTGGTVTFNISNLNVGTHHLFAVYNGDATHATSQSSQVSQVVNSGAAATTTALTDNGPSPSAVNQPVSFTVTITGGTPINGQTVSIKDADNSNAVVATPTLTNSTVTFNISSLTVGTHHLFADYAGDATHTASQSSQVTQVVNNALVVLSTQLTNSGVIVTFNQAIDPAPLNQYLQKIDDQSAIAATAGRAMTLTSSATPTSPVLGSVVLSNGNKTAYFLKTGANAPGVLPSDPTYTLTLNTTANGFKTTTGTLLTGTNTFTYNVAAASTPVVGLPDFARGPLQSAANTTGFNLSTGLPISISNAAGLTSIRLQVTYDPTMLTLPTTNGVAVVAGAGAPAGWAASGFTNTLNANGTRTLDFTLSGATAWPAGLGTIGRITGWSIPGNAPYAGKEALTVSVVSTNLAAVRGDAAVQVVAYAGDVEGKATVAGTNPSAVLSANDASIVLNDAAQLANQTAFAATANGRSKFALLDPKILASGDNHGVTSLAYQAVSASDASNILNNAQNIPSLTGVPNNAATAGNDPRIFFNNFNVIPGQTVTVAVNLQVTESAGLDLRSADLNFRYDPAVLTNPSNIRVGSLTGGYLIASNTATAGQVYIGLATTHNNLAFNTTGTVALIDFVVASGAPVGAFSPLNLVPDNGGAPTQVNGDPVNVTPYPTFAATDANVDAQATVTQPQVQIAFPPSTNTSAGTQITVPVNLSALTPVDLRSFDLNFTYDATRLQFVNVTQGSLTGGYLIASNSGTPGQLYVGLATTHNNQPAGATGTVVVITFNVLGTATGAAFLNVTTQLGGPPTQVNGGSVEINPPGGVTTNPGGPEDGVVNVVLQPNQPPFNAVPDTTNSPAPRVLFNPAAAAGLRAPTPNAYVFSTANGNAITVTDSGFSATGPNETTTLTLTGTGSTGPVGTLTLGSTAGVTVTGNNTATVTITGTPSAITAALNGLKYTPGAGFYGTANLAVSTNDNGNSGFGGPLTDTRSTQVTVVGLYLSEITLADNAGLAEPLQYLEVFTTVGGFTIPNNVYVVSLNGNSSSSILNFAGDVTDVFKLAGFTTGSNGYLALLQKSNAYVSAGVVSTSGTVVTNSGSDTGFGNGIGSSVYGTVNGVHTGTSGAGGSAFDAQLASASYLLIQSPTVPMPGDHIDAAVAADPVNGVPSGMAGGAEYNSWNVLDGVGIIDSTPGDFSADTAYAPVVFRASGNPTATTLPGAQVISTSSWTASYAARIGQNTGYSAADWLASQPVSTGTAGKYVLDANSTAFAGQALNHIGAPNNWAPAMSVQVNDGNAQHAQVSYLVLNFNQPVTINTTNLALVFQVKDAANNLVPIDVTSNGTVSGTTLINVTRVTITFQTGSPDVFTFTSAVTTSTPQGPNLSAAGLASITTGLNDGNYFLSTDGTRISSNGVLLDWAHNGNPGAGGTQTDEFWRLFGDSRGRRTVDGLSVNDFRLANNSGTAKGANTSAYRWYFDFNEDANIDRSTPANTIDQAAFLARLYTTLNP